MKIRSTVICLLALAAAATALPAEAAGRPASIACPSNVCQVVARDLGQTENAVEDGQGGLLLSASNGTLRRLVLATGKVSTVATGLGNLRGLAADGQGNAFVASFDGSLQKVNVATGATSTVFRTGTALIAVASAGGSTYVTSHGGQLWEIRDGQAPRSVTTGLGYTDTIALDGRGNAFTADMMTQRIQRTNLATGATTLIATTTYEMTSLAFGPDGNLYFDLGGDVWRLNPVSGQKAPIASLPTGTFYWDLAADGSIYTPNSTIHRITGVTTL
ncbi:hypothetical protein OG474_27510 [Kribbella sp. NBC_01505]|uniref:hypothetical protein n=1 Tax=Kribbella sp. NBC_01505 TaxID=2903580 RepID=UPI0038687CF3